MIKLEIIEILSERSESIRGIWNKKFSGSTFDVGRGFSWLKTFPSSLGMVATTCEARDGCDGDDVLVDELEED